MKLKCVCCGNLNNYYINYNNYGYEILKKSNEDIFKDLKIHVCQNCGYGWSYPIIENIKLTEFYKTKYSAEGTMHAWSWPQKFVDNKNAISIRYVSQFNLITLFKDKDSIKKILEIGPGQLEGKMTADLLGFKSDYFVFEEDNSKNNLIISNNVKRLNQHEGKFLLKEYSNKFDLVIMSHVLEHFQFDKILETINDIYEMLSSGGCFLIEVPNNDFRNIQADIDHSPHLSFFSQSSFKNLINQTKFKVLFSSSKGNMINKSPYVKPILSGLKKKLKKVFMLKSLVRFLRNLFLFFKIIIKNIENKFFFRKKIYLRSAQFNYANDRQSIVILLVKP